MVDRGGDTAPRRAALEHLLGARLETQRLDVVWISQAPVDLAFAIISQGRLIYESDVATRVEFEAQIMSRYFDYLPVLRAQRAEILAGGKVALEFSGIERRLDELSERLGRLEPLRAKSKPEFAADPYLRDIAERNLEVAAQCVLDIAHRLISLTGALKPPILQGGYHVFSTHPLFPQPHGLPAPGRGPYRPVQLAYRPSFSGCLYPAHRGYR
jgi:hypothetical protein